ncbi:zinc finger protein 711-like [Halictus rubicundus]|uniref:zinc finger protein 711-like n=1 Tax=Halictus rubicundus TaxID=77578 RepID=UPI0040353C08
MPGNSFAINSSTNWEQLTVSMTYLLSDPSMQFIEQTIHDTHCPPECLAPIQSSLVKLSIHPEQTDPLQNSQIQHEDSKKLNRLNISRNDEGFKTTKEESPKRANTNNAKKHDGMIDPVLDSVRTTCPFCEKQFQDIPKLEAHVKNLHRNPKKVYKCDMCQTYCYSQKKLEQHKVIHRPDYFFKCNICEAKYKWKASLKKHILRIHTEHDTTFTMTRNLTQHIKRCHDFPLQVCQFCGKEVKNLKTHEWRHEKRIKQSEYEYCFLCTNNFRHRSSMDNHLIGHATTPQTRPYSGLQLHALSEEVLPE